MINAQKVHSIIRTVPVLSMVVLPDTKDPGPNEWLLVWRGLLIERRGLSCEEQSDWALRLPISRTRVMRTGLQMKSLAKAMLSSRLSTARYHTLFANKTQALTTILQDESSPNLPLRVRRPLKGTATSDAHVRCQLCIEGVP